MKQTITRRRKKVRMLHRRKRRHPMLSNAKEMEDLFYMYSSEDLPEIESDLYDHEVRPEISRDYYL